MASMKCKCGTVFRIDAGDGKDTYSIFDMESFQDAADHVEEDIGRRAQGQSLSGDDYFLAVRISLSQAGHPAHLCPICGRLMIFKREDYSLLAVYVLELGSFGRRELP
jgi:hypothetical protein